MKGPILGVVLGLVGAAILFGAGFAGWYQFQYNGTFVPHPANRTAGYSFGGSTIFLPGSNFRSTAYCNGGTSACGQPATRAEIHPYANPGPGQDDYTQTGRLYEVLQVILWVTTALALVGLAAGWIFRGGRGIQRGVARGLLAAAVVLAFAAPIAVWVVNPYVTHADYSGSSNGLPANFTGPGGSFWGTCSEPSCGSGGGITDSWGPDLGWYMGWIGAVTLAIGALLLARWRPPPTVENVPGGAVAPSAIAPMVDAKPPSTP